MYQWFEIDEKVINLDNVAFWSKGVPVQAFDEADPRQCKCNFIGGQSIVLESITYSGAMNKLKEHFSKMPETKGTLND